MQNIFQNKKIRIISIIAIVVLVLGFSFFFFKNQSPEAEAGWWDEQWYYRKALVVDYTKVDSDLTNFPVAVQFNTTNNIYANTNSDGSDLRFTDINGNILKYEIEKWNESGTSTVWVKLPTVYASASTTFYIYYGNPSATDDQTPSEVWDDDFVMVQHMNNTATSTGAFVDSTSYNNHGTGYGGESLVATTTGVTDGAFEFDGSNDSVEVLNDPSLSGMAQITVSAWINLDQLPSTLGSNAKIVEKRSSVSPWWSYILNIREAQCGVDTIVWGTSNADGAESYFCGATSLTSGNWYYVVGTWDGSDRHVYLNGINDDDDVTSYSTANLFISNSDLVINYDANIDGKIDDIRISKVARSTAWIKAEYFNGINTLVTQSSEEKGPGPIAYWSFDEGYGTTAYDYSPNNNDGTITNAIWKDESECISGKCLYFDGSGDYITFSSITLLRAGSSVCFWYKSIGDYSANYGGRGTILSWKNPYSYLISLKNTAGSLYSWDAESNTNGDYIVSTNYLYNPNQWQQFCMVMDNNQVSTYLDGILIDTETADDNLTLNVIGAGNYTSIDPTQYQFFNGYLDDIKIYNYARSVDQINQDYNKGLSISLGNSNPYASLSDGLIGWWKMDETIWNGTAGEVKDSSGNNLNGTAVSGANTTSTAKFNRAVNITDESNDALSMGTSDKLNFPTQNFSISAWVKQETNANILIRKGGGYSTSAPGYSITASNFQISSTNKVIYNASIGSSLTNGVWSHLIYTIDRQGYIKKYINGELSGQVDISADILENISSSDTFYISQASSQEWVGGIDEVRVYNRVLSPDEVRHLYEWAPGPIVHWKFEEASGINTYDSSGNNISGVLGTDGAGSDVPTWAPGKYGSALEYADDHVRFSDNNNLDTGDQVTFMGWYKFDNLTFRNDVYLYNRNSQSIANGFHIIWVNASSTIGYQYGNGSAIVGKYSNSMSWELGRWYHIAITHDNIAKQINFYRDGINVGVQTYTDNALNVTSGNAFIGGYQGDSRLRGQADDIRIYNYIRNERQIREDMNAGRQNNPIAYWSFDEGQGTTTNDYIGSNDGVMTNMYTNTITAWSGNGKSSNALLFDGVNDYIDFGDDSLYTTDISVSAWFKTTSNSADMVLFANDSSSILDSIGMDLGHIAYSKSGNTFMRETVNTFNDGQWHHLVLDTAGTRIYIDGVLQTLQNGSMYRLSNRVSIGSRYLSSWDQYWNGYIDEVKIYNYPITLDEIRQNFNIGLQNRLGSSQTDEKSDGLVGWWKLDESSWNGTAGEVKDSSGIGNNGVATNANTTSTAKYERAGLFTGTSYVNLGQAANLEMGSDGAVTVSMWVRPTSLSNYGQLFFGGGGGGAQGYGTKLDSSGNFNYEIMGASGVRYNYTSAFGLQVNTWYHITAIFDGKNNRMQAYLNGELKHSVEIPEPGAVNNANNFYLGMHAGPTWYYNGFMDDVKVYNTVRSPEQIVREYVEGPPPIRYWKFDEMSGATVADSAGTNYIGSLNNSPTWTVEGKVGGALEFDGVNDLVELSSTAAPTLQQMSLSLYIKTDHSGNDQGIISKYQNWSYWNYQIYSDTNGKIKYNIGYTNGGDYIWETTLTSNQSINDNQWHHIVATYDRNQMKIYIDGVLDNSVNEDRMYLSGSSPLYIGAGTYNDDITLHYDESDVTFDGMIDEVKIYNYALSPRQVALENSGGAPVGYWKFDEGEGEQIGDNSGNGNQGILIVGTGGTQSATSSAWVTAGLGKVNGAINLDGTDDYISLPNNIFSSPGVNEYTISWWQNLTNKGSGQAILNQNNFPRIQYYNVNKTVRVNTFTPDTDALGYNVEYNQWQHITVLIKTNKIEIYRNGALVGTNTGTITFSSGNVMIGASGGASPTNFAQGKIDELKVYNYALTPEEVKKEYNGGFSSYFK